MAVGTAVLDFGAVPGTAMASVVVTGQAGIASNSRVEAFVSLTQGASVDHSVDEHMVERLRIKAGSIVAGVGFTIFGEVQQGFAYGKWNIDWVWV